MGGLVKAIVRRTRLQNGPWFQGTSTDPAKPCVLYILDAILVGFEGILLYVEQVDSVHGPTGSPRTESTCSELKFEWVETWMSHFLRSS